MLRLNKQFIFFDKVIKKFSKPLVIFSILLILVTSIIFIILLFYGGCFTLSEMGDFLGGYIGAMLSVLTVLLLFQTYYSQKEELREQRVEIKLQRKALENQNQVMNMQKDISENSRVYDIIYRESQFINEYISIYERDVLPLYKHIETMEGDIKNEHLLGDTPGTVKYFIERYNTISNNLFNLIDSLYSYFKRLEYLLSDRSDKDKLISISTNKLPHIIEELCKSTNDYLRMIANNPNNYKFKNFNEEKSLKIADKCGIIKTYIYDDIFRDK